MAQAGKVYPYATFQDFGRQAGDVAIKTLPPRKLHLLNEGAAVGVLALPWEGLELISSLVERIGDELHWKIERPGDPDDYILIRGGPVAIDPPSWPGPSNVNFIGEREYWYHGTMYGRGAVSRSSTSAFTLFPTSWCGATGNWQSLVNPSQFQRMGDNIRIGSASWTDQPDYQPYRTRP